MQRICKAYVQCIESFNENLANIFDYSLWVMIGVMLFETVSRYVLNNPHSWVQEFTQYTLGATFSFGGAYVLMTDEHVRMDVLYIRWSVKTKAIVNTITFGLVAAYLISFIRGGINNTVFSIRFNHHTTSGWGPHLGVIKMILLIGGVLLFLQVLALLIKDIYLIKGKSL